MGNAHRPDRAAKDDAGLLISQIEKREALDPSEQPTKKLVEKPEHPKIKELLASLNITSEDLPDKWNIFSFNSKLEFISDRILINSRKGITKHSELKDFLSPTQLERRYRREIQSKNGGWDDDIRHGEYWRHYNYELDKKPHKKTE